MEELFEEADIEEWDSTEAVADKLQEAFIKMLEGDERVLTGDGEYQSHVTPDDVARLIKLRQNAPEPVQFKQVSKHECDGANHPKSKTDTGRGEDAGHDSTTVYNITCPKCYSHGDVEVTSGWNAYYECSHCGQNIIVSS